MKIRLSSLDSLRGMAAIMVSLFHFQTASPLTNNHYINNAYMFVELFFVLSGFVMSYQYAERLNSIQKKKEFILKRFYRLYPLHIFMFTVFLFIEILKFAVEQYFGLVANEPAFSQNNARYALLNFLLLNGSPLAEVATYDKPSWSISAEFIIYLIFCILYFKYLKQFSLVIILASLWILIKDHSRNEIPIELSVYRCSYSFFLGVLGHQYSSTIKFAKFNELLVMVLFILSVLAITYAHELGIYRHLISVIFVFLIISLSSLRKDSYISRILNMRYFVTLGTISYSIYLTHAAVWWFLQQGLRFKFGYTPGRALGSSNLYPVYDTLITLLGLAIIIVVSHVTYRFIEVKFRRNSA